MSVKDDKLYQSAVMALVNIKVVDGNKKLLINTEDKEWLKKVQKIFKERYPHNQYILQDFAVMVIRSNRISGVVKWVEIKGFSLWEKKDWQLSA